MLVGRGGAGPHDLVQMARQGRVYAAAAESQYYAEPKRLEHLGYLASRKEPGRTHQRTHYTLTEQGLAALREWATQPVHFPRVLHEGVVRLLAADPPSAAPSQEQQQALASTPQPPSILALADELDELDSLLDRADTVAGGLPHREKYLRINHELARRLIRAHRDWIADVERGLA